MINKVNAIANTPSQKASNPELGFGLDMNCFGYGSFLLTQLLISEQLKKDSYPWPSLYVIHLMKIYFQALKE